MSRTTGLRASASVALVALAITAGCGSDSGGDDGGSAKKGGEPAVGITPPKLHEDGVLKVCADVSFPPMQYFESASSTTPIGFDVDLGAEVAKRWGAEQRIINTAFDGLLPALGAGRCDVVWSSIAVLPARTDRFPAVGYFTTSTVLLVRHGNPEQITSLEDLAGRTVAVESGTAVYTEIAEKVNRDLEKKGLPTFDLQRYPKATDTVQQLVVGRADAVITQGTEAAFRMEQDPGQFEVGYTFPDRELAGVYFRPDSPDMGEALTETLTAMQSDGTLEEVAEKWQFDAQSVDVKIKVHGASADK